ncbi:MAG: ribose 5-phosphate isomerase B [Oscillospiraceae bacterium]|nr:ribose 5-phosphate isomerase B [Oscillospiraceae bacterium]
MTIALGSDHGGFALKEHIKAYLQQEGYAVEDCGCHTPERVDYPVYARLAAEAVTAGRCEYGIVVCTSGIGISIAANKIKGIRCALCNEPYAAEMTRRHNNANMLALGGGMTGPNLAERIVHTFLTTGFEGGRHQQRVDLISALES